MNKKTAIVSGVFTMMGIVLVVGFVASREVSARQINNTGSGMLKKPINIMPEGRSEYRTNVAMSELDNMQKELKTTLNKLRDQRTPIDGDILMQLPDNINRSFDEILSRHVRMYPSDVEKPEYIQKKDETENLLKEVTALSRAKIDEFSK
jgi:hypothetical protein